MTRFFFAAALAACCCRARADLVDPWPVETLNRTWTGELCYHVHGEITGPAGELLTGGQIVKSCAPPAVAGGRWERRLGKLRVGRLELAAGGASGSTAISWIDAETLDTRSVDVAATVSPLAFTLPAQTIELDLASFDRGYRETITSGLAGLETSTATVDVTAAGGELTAAASQQTTLLDPPAYLAHAKFSPWNDRRALWLQKTTPYRRLDVELGAHTLRVSWRAWFELTMDAPGPRPIATSIADQDADGDVDASDLTEVVLSWSGAGSPADGIAGDIDWDGDVDGADLTEVVISWTGPQQAAIPEPSSWLAALIGSASIRPVYASARRSRRRRSRPLRYSCR